jgi:ribonuclease HI
LITSIYTDGACSGNPGPGGWGVVVNFSDGSVTELGGGSTNTTNNQMELQASIAALKFLQEHKQSEPIELFTDSKYVIDGINSWIAGWKRNGWRTASKQPVKNKELWETLDRYNSAQVQWRWVKGHAGDRDNERCDAIARAYSSGKIPQLRS